MPQMNARPPPSFQRSPFPSQVLQQYNLEAMMEGMLMAQQKQGTYIKQLASTVDVLTTRNRMLEAHITQKASFSSTPLDRLPSRSEPNPREHCNCVTLKEVVDDITDPEDILMEEGREIIMAGSNERNDGGKMTTLIENDIIEIPTISPL